MPVPPLPPPGTPSGVTLVRWALTVHAGLWVLITLMQAVSQAASPTAPARSSWLRLLIAVAMTAALGFVAVRLARSRPWTWAAAGALQVAAAVAYGWLAQAITADPAPGAIPAGLAVGLGFLLVAISLAGVCSLLGRDVRRYCLGTGR